MRIDLPQCGFHYCRFQFDGNCTSTGKYKKCEYRYLSEQIEPQKKGKWIERDDCWDGIYYECSVCKDSFTLIDGNPSDNNYNFCPSCGSYNGGEEE